MAEDLESQIGIPRSGVNPDLKLRIFDAAISCFERCGYFETDFDDIAREAKIEVGEITRIFHSKDALLADFLYICDMELKDKLDFDDNPNAPALDRIYYVCKTTLLFLGHHKAITSIWFEFYRHNVAKVVLKEFFFQMKERIEEQVKAGITDGSIKEISLRDIVETTVALTEGILILSRLEGTSDIEERFQKSWDILISGLRV